MDLTSALANFQTSQVLAEVQIQVARKVMDMQQLQGAAMVKLIDAAGKSATQAGDSLVAAATGLGGEIDTFG
jgi:hypothetical protein